MVHYVNVFERMKQEKWGDVIESHCGNPSYVYKCYK